jgi:Mrp family chromosome partitioning ATPase
MAARIDGNVMVVRINKTSISSVKKAIKEIRSLRLPLLGTIDNKVYLLLMTRVLANLTY